MSRATAVPHLKISLLLLGVPTAREKDSFTVPLNPEEPLRGRRTGWGLVKMFLTRCSKLAIPHWTPKTTQTGRSC